MGNFVEAISSLKNAEQEYPCGHHEHAVVLWMLGTVQWFFENEHAEAMMKWKDAIEEFRLLEMIHEQAQREVEKNWYCERIAKMEARLVQMTRRKFLGR